MKKENTLQEVQEQIFELQEEREKCDIKLRQLQSQGKKLEKLANEKERKRRNHRLIQRGLIVERVVKNSLMFTNEEIEKISPSFYGEYKNVSLTDEEYGKLKDKKL